MTALAERPKLAQRLRNARSSGASSLTVMVMFKFQKGNTMIITLPKLLCATKRLKLNPASRSSQT